MLLTQSKRLRGLCSTRLLARLKSSKSAQAQFSKRGVSGSSDVDADADSHSSKSSSPLILKSLNAVLKSTNDKHKRERHEPRPAKLDNPGPNRVRDKRILEQIRDSSSVFATPVIQDAANVSPEKMPSYIFAKKVLYHKSFMQLVARLDSYCMSLAKARSFEKSLDQDDVEVLSLVSAGKSSIAYSPVDVPDQPPVPQLEHGLDKVLFNPGVNFLKDPRTNHYNFNPKLETNVNITEFDFNKLPPFISAHKDVRLRKIANENKCNFLASTSGLTGILTQFHHALSCNRLPQIMSLSKFFDNNTTEFSSFQTMPTLGAITKPKDEEAWALKNSDKSFTEGILSHLGQAMEVMLVSTPEHLEEYKRADPKEPVIQTNKELSEGDESQENLPHTYAYTKVHDFLIRSQLDCYDPRLPGTGTFDLKTRAVCAVRHDIDYAQSVGGSNYQIRKLDGLFESYTREFYELIRSALFKYSLQARMGRMDGIFLAYHNITQLFGFQYLPLEDIDKIYHSSHLLRPEVGSIYAAKEDLDTKMAKSASLIADQEFKLSVELISSIFKKILKELSKDNSLSYEYIAHSPDKNQLLFIFTPSETGETSIPVASVVEELKLKASNQESILEKLKEPTSSGMPAGTRVFSCTMLSHINGRPLPRGESPSPSFDYDKWTVDALLSEFKDDLAKVAYQKTIKKYKDFQSISRPILDQSPESETLRDEFLANLPAPSQLQRTLRGFSEKKDSIWDSD